VVFIRKSAGRSGATKVQIAERRGGRNHIVEHVGTARSEAELAVLMAAGIGSLECAPALVAVKVVRPVGRSTLTAPARRRVGRGAGPGRGFARSVFAGSVVGAGPGSG